MCVSASSLTDLGMDEDDDEPVPLPNVNGAIMKKVMRLQMSLLPMYILTLLSFYLLLVCYIICACSV